MILYESVYKFKPNNGRPSLDVETVHWAPKNCTLVTDGVACFPDAVTARWLKHLKELQDQVRLGDRSVIFYLVQRMDARLFRPADHIDPVYGQELRKAINNGVEIMVFDVAMDLKRIELNREIPFEV